MDLDTAKSLTIVSVQAVLGAEVIDGGDTIVLRLCCADGAPGAVIARRDVAQAMVQALSNGLSAAAQVRRDADSRG